MIRVDFRATLAVLGAAAELLILMIDENFGDVLRSFYALVSYQWRCCCCCHLNVVAAEDVDSNKCCLKKSLTSIIFFGEPHTFQTTDDRNRKNDCQ